MKSRKLMLTVAAAAVGAAMSVPAQAQKLSGDVVRIGVLTDLASLYADLSGQGSVTATQMAVEDFGGTVLGKKIEVVSADHQNKPDIGAAKAREWIDTQGVDVITELVTSSVALAVMKVGADKKKPVLVVTAATTRITNEDCNPYTVHWMYDTYALANGTGTATTKQGGNTWFFITADYAFGHSLEKDTAEAVKAAGGKVLGQVRHPLNASDFSSFLLQAQSSKAKVVGLANAGGDTINAIKAANEFGLTKTQNLAGLLMFDTDIHSLGLKTTQGMMLTTGYYWDRDETSRKFAKRYFERMKKMPTMVQAGQYSATLNYLRAVKAAGTDDGDAVMAELKKMKISDEVIPNGKIRADGRLVHDMYLAQVKKPEESKYPWDYYHIKQVIPADQAFQSLAQSKCSLVKK
jgi:branched-chain amino acid transport system substrate-binding protein